MARKTTISRIGSITKVVIFSPGYGGPDEAARTRAAGSGRRFGYHLFHYKNKETANRNVQNLHKIQSYGVMVLQFTEQKTQTVTLELAR